MGVVDCEETDCHSWNRNHTQAAMQRRTCDEVQEATNKRFDGIYLNNGHGPKPFVCIVEQNIDCRYHVSVVCQTTGCTVVKNCRMSNCHLSRKTSIVAIMRLSFVEQHITLSLKTVVC
jgi:hypothetical protein